MRNILKGFLNPKAKAYEFPEADSFVMEKEKPVTDQPKEEGGSFGIPKQWGGREDDLPQPRDRAAEEKQEAPPGPDSPVQYARLQAELILNQAREEADQIIESTRSDLQEEMDQIRKDARAEGFRAGYADGAAKAREDVAREREELAKRMEEDVKNFLEKASLAREELLNQTQEELLDLCIAVAEKVVRVSLRSSSEVIVRMIQAATERMKRQEWVHIYIPGCDAKGITQISPALTTTLAGLSQHIKIIPMGDEEDGTCIIETPEGIVDASVSTQMSAVRDIIGERLNAQR